jgi:hypothetical protein
MARDTNIVWGDSTILFMKSDTDGLYIMPWRLLHDGYEVTRQNTITSVDPDAGIPITHSKFTNGGRIISSKIYTNTEPEFWNWYKMGIKERALPFWVYDVKVDGFMKCYMTETPTLSPANNSINACYIQLKLYAVSGTIPVRKFITENTPEKMVVEGNNIFVCDNDEVIY